jgi:hypothetical protein
MMVGILEMLNGFWRNAFSGFFHLHWQAERARSIPDLAGRAGSGHALGAVTDKDEGAVLLGDETLDLALHLGAVCTPCGGMMSTLEVSLPSPVASRQSRPPPRWS